MVFVRESSEIEKDLILDFCPKQSGSRFDISIQKAQYFDIWSVKMPYSRFIMATPLGVDI